MNTTEQICDFETSRALSLLGFPQSENKRPRFGKPHYYTHYKSNTIHELVSLTIGHIHSYDVMCYAPTKKEACEWLKTQIEKMN